MSAARDTRQTANLVLFLIGVGFLGAASGLFETTFNNFLSDTFDISPAARGFLEFPRELPGFLTALFVGALFFLPETRIASAAALAVSVGMFGIAFGGRDWTTMLVYLTLWSTGAHVIMPVRSSVSMDLAHEGRRGRRLGQVQGVGIASSIVGCAVVWITMKRVGADYTLILCFGAAAALVAAVALWFMRMPDAHLSRPRFVWRRRYWLYYTLAFLFGARKQIFITFGPWVLVRVFHQPAYIFAQLWIAAALLGVVFQPALGRAIDRFGERLVLMADSALILLICLGYGWSHVLPYRGLALALLYACFVADNLLFGVNMARDTYLAKIAERPEDISPSLSLGVTINHAVSMSLPAVGGLVWAKMGHPAVFMAAAGVAVLMAAFSSLVSTPERPARP